MDSLPCGYFITNAVSVIPGLRLNESRDIEYLYTAKPGTRDVVEMMNIYFTRNRKS